MENDRITEYVKNHPEVDPVNLVSNPVSPATALFECSDAKLRSCGMWRTVFTTSTRRTLYMET